MAGDINVDIDGDEALAKAFDKMVRLYSSSISKGMTRAILFVHSQIPGYPPTPPSSTYKRTGTLGRSVTSLQGSAPGALSRVKSFGDQITGIVGSNIKYAKYVISKGDQAKVHIGRWYTLQAIVEENQGGIKSILDDEMDKLKQRSGLK